MPVIIFASSSSGKSAHWPVHSVTGLAIFISPVYGIFVIS
jgi:hypothetical protein